MDKIGKYVILEVIGRGGMGTVYRARDTVIGRDVAIKVIAEHVASHPNVKERLYQEATSAGRLSHEHIMTIFDVGEKDGQPYLVMELLDGIDLRSASDGGRRMSFDRKLEIALQICRGLAYAHARGVVHRDIKPENIRILSTGRLKILDFGIARIESETRTMTHSSIGTPRYMSPEQVRGKEIDHRTDIFSFGVVLYELLSGINPFDGTHVTAVIYKILHEEPEPVTVDDEELSADMQRIVARCLEKEVDERYPDFTTVIRDLEDVRSKRQAEASTLFHDRRVIEDASDERSPRYGATPLDEPKPGASARSESWTPAPPTTERKAASSTYRAGTEERSPRRPRWLVPAVAAIAVGLSVGGYFVLQAGSGGDQTPQSAVSTAMGTSAGGEFAELEQEVVRLQEEMLVDKQNAEPFSEMEGLAGLYQDALREEREAVAALDEQTASSYRRAADAFVIAKNTFRAVAIAGQNDENVVRAQAESSRQAMERARRNVYAERSSPEIADVYSRAEAAGRRGAGQFESGEYAAALASFGQAEAGFDDARRTLDRAAALQEVRRRSEAAQAAMEDQRSKVSAWRDAPANTAAYEQAEGLRREGLALVDGGRHEEAVTRFERAQAAFARVREPVETTPSVTASAADEARNAMQQSKTRVPNVLREHERYAEAANLEQRAQRAYSDGSFDDAVELFRQADETYATAAALPLPKTAEEEVRETLLPLLNQFKVSLEAKDEEGLRQIHRFLGAYSAMFDVAEDIRAEIGHSNLRVSNGRATVSVSVDMTYRNRTQRMRTENQNVGLLWTLEDEGSGRWQLQEIARP